MMILTIKKLVVKIIKFFSYILYKVLNFFEYILFKLTKKKYLVYLYEHIRKHSYTKVKVNNKILNFFTSNEIIQHRIKTYFSEKYNIIVVILAACGIFTTVSVSVKQNKK